MEPICTVATWHIARLTIIRRRDTTNLCITYNECYPSNGELRQLYEKATKSDAFGPFGADFKFYHASETQQQTVKKTTTITALM